MNILWLTAFHVFFMVAWMAGIFYLPRLFVYHAEATEQVVKDTFNVMQRRLWWFVTPFAVLTFVFGVLIIKSYGSEWLKASPWLHVKITLAMLFYAYHGYLYYLHMRFVKGINTKSPRFYRFLNEVPVLVLLAIIILAVVKPSFS